MRRERLLRLVPVVLLAVAGLVPVAAPVGAAPSHTSDNLIVDGGAEAARCTADGDAATTVPGWTITKGSPSAICYSRHRGAHPRGRGGRAYFGPGPYLHSAAMTQTASVSRRRRVIDSGAVVATLTGWLGGTANDPGRATVSVSFLGAHGRRLGGVALATVTAKQRHEHTGFRQRSATATIPAGTRTLRTAVEFVQTGGARGYSAHAHSSGGVDNLSLTISATILGPRLAPPASRVPRMKHVFMIMMENTDESAVLGKHNHMPFFDRLRRKGTTFANYHAVYHPSDENYLAIAGGDVYADGAIYWPDLNDPARNIADELQHRGESWKAYEQGMGTPCNIKASTEHRADPYYAPDDTPFSSYTDISRHRKRCRAHLVDSNELQHDLQHAGTTPNFSWIAADDYYDGESAGNGNAASRRVQDSWLDETITPILRSAAWRTQRSMLIVTWDETANQSANTVANLVLGSQHTVHAGRVSGLRTDHYSTGRTIEDALGIEPLTPNDRYAVPLNPAFTGAAGP